MKKSILALMALAFSQSSLVLADGRGYNVSGAVVVGGPVGPRGYYGYGNRWGYPGPRVGVYFGGPAVWGWPWGPPAYYPPPVVYPQVVAVPPAVVYVEKADEAGLSAPPVGEPLEPGYWYYCREQGAYYPVARECQGAWQKVAPIRK